MLRGHPDLVVELLGGPKSVYIPPYDAIVSDSADLGAAIAPELAADCLLRVERNGQTVLVVIVEVQLSIDLQKTFSWPAYLIGARTRHRCDAMLAVIAPYASVANWARRPIEIGPNAGFVRPTVIGPEEMPSVLHLDEACKLPELAVLSAITHGHDDDAVRAAAIASTAIAAAFTLNDHRAQVYYDLTAAALSDAAREALQMIPQNYEYQDEGLRRAKAEGELKGKAEGELKGKAEGELKGKAEGELKATALALIGVLETRGFVVDPEVRSRVFACGDVEKLRSWLFAAVSAPSLDAAFA